MKLIPAKMVKQLPAEFKVNAAGTGFEMVCLDGMTVKIQPVADGKGWVSGRYYGNGNPQSAMWHPTWKEVVRMVNEQN